MLGFNVARFVHVFHGWVFGPIVRRVFMGSIETSRNLDCIFETSEDAEYFLSALKIEHVVEFKCQATHGLHEFSVRRPFHDGTVSGVELRIHAMNSGLTRGKRLPRNIPEPCFDLDYFFWRRDGLREGMPPCCRRPQHALDQSSWLAYGIERLQQRRFCVVNGLCLRSPKAMLLTLDACLHMVAEEGFVQDNPYIPFIETPLVFLHEPQTAPDATRTFCPIKQEGLGDFEPAVRLPVCGHVFSFAGIHGWIEEKGLRGQPGNPDGTIGRSVSCPLCQRVFVSKAALGETSFADGPASAAGLRTGFLPTATTTSSSSPPGEGNAGA